MLQGLHRCCWGSTIKRRGGLIVMRCLFCYGELSGGEKDFHKKCSRKIFGVDEAPVLPYNRASISELAKMVVRNRVTIPGVQAKLSLDFDNAGGEASPRRFTIVGLWGKYILKTQTDYFCNLPELEDVTMHMAELSGINVVPHSLIRFSDGELCYITRRIDRTATGGKLHMEDMCQLSERLTEYKYSGSYEQIAKIIIKYSSVPNLDLVNFWEMVLFSWITGNADMHLKNFSLYSRRKGEYELSPGYDRLSTAIVMPEDSEELALALNGKKRKLKKDDFIAAMQKSMLNDKVIHNILNKFDKYVLKWFDLIDISFLPDEMKMKYKELIACKINKLH